MVLNENALEMEWMAIELIGSVERLFSSYCKPQRGSICTYCTVYTQNGLWRHVHSCHPVIPNRRSNLAGPYWPEWKADQCILCWPTNWAIFSRNQVVSIDNATMPSSGCFDRRSSGFQLCIAMGLGHTYKPVFWVSVEKGKSSLLTVVRVSTLSEEPCHRNDTIAVNVIRPFEVGWLLPMVLLYLSVN